MPGINHTQRELHLKIVYYGPGLGGKTTNLEHIHQRSRPENRGKLISLMTETERTLFFDLLPIHLGKFRGYSIRMHLCTVPGQIALDSTRRLVLRHVDGVVFVVDSQRERLEANLQSFLNLDENLRLQGDDPDAMPMVVQYNKRDLVNVLPLDELRDALKIDPTTPQFEACAVEGRGVFETFKSITTEALKSIGDPSLMPEGRTASILPGKRASMFAALSASEE